MTNGLVGRLPARAPSLASLASLAAAVLSLVTACAPSLSSMETARVVGRGHVRVHGGYEAEISTGAVRSVVDVGKTLAGAARTRTLSDSEKLQLFDAGVVLLTLPPSFSPLIGATVGLTDDWEVGLRYAGQGVRLGSRYQLLRHETGPFDMVVGLGVSRAVTSVPVSDVIDVIKVDDFSRTNLDVPLLLGTSRSYFRAWGGPTFMFTHASTRMRLELRDQDVPATAQFIADGIFLGAQGGIAFGWKRIFVGFELTIARFLGTAHTDAATVAAGVGHDVSLASTVFQPTIGLIGEI